MANRTKATAEKKAAFLHALRDLGGNVGRAAKRVRVNRGTFYAHRLEDADFAQAWDKAIADSESILEDEALRRAVDGTLKPVYQGGKRVGTVREYSDTLLIFMLKARNPKRYRESMKHEMSGPDGGPIQTQGTHAIDLTKCSEDELRLLQGIAARHEDTTPGA